MKFNCVTIENISHWKFFTPDQISKITVTISRLKAKYVIMQVHACTEKSKSWQLVAMKENKPGLC